MNVSTASRSSATLRLAIRHKRAGVSRGNHLIEYRSTDAAGNREEIRSCTVWIGSKPGKAITAFSLQGLAPPVAGSITEAGHIIALTVPFGTDVSALVATFTLSPSATVEVGATPQVSGTTANDFSSPVTYTVTAADASTQDYEVTVTVAPLAIGDAYQGGIVAYILQPGDPGYIAGETHGLIAAPVDQVFTATGQDQGHWRPARDYGVPLPTDLALGTGFTNTEAIVTQIGPRPDDPYAAYVAWIYDGGGYTDWFLPSRDELDKMWLNRTAIGGLYTGLWDYYWSSSERGGVTDAWCERFSDGWLNLSNEWNSARVRAMRYF